MGFVSTLRLCTPTVYVLGSVTHDEYKCILRRHDWKIIDARAGAVIEHAKRNASYIICNRLISLHFCPGDQLQALTLSKLKERTGNNLKLQIAVINIYCQKASCMYSNELADRPTISSNC